VLITPKEYYGAMVDLIKERRGSEIEVLYLDDGQVSLTSTIPWQEVVCDMHDQIKHSSSGRTGNNLFFSMVTLFDIYLVTLLIACPAASTSHTLGYASFNYEDAGYQAGSLVKVEIAVNGEPCEPLSFVCHTDKAVATGRKMALKLKEVIDRQQFEIIIQARIGIKVKYNRDGKTHVLS
jgi:translation elongation factor EF-4